MSAELERGIDFSTFSIIGRCERTGMFGIAIATSEMVQVQARPLIKRPPPPQQPAPPPNDDSAFRIDAGGTVLLLPSSAPLALGGPELALEHRRSFTGQVLYARWLVGEGDGQRARWLEIGAA